MIINIAPYFNNETLFKHRSYFKNNESVYIKIMYNLIFHIQPHSIINTNQETKVFKFKGNKIKIKVISLNVYLIKIFCYT